jgi:tetratricopeptide (TPR) repeat protein
VAIDRESSLRRAEKLLRQGRLDGAIEEYLRVIEDQPTDWNTANLLGDLYVRAGQLDRAAGQYSRIADHFAREGFLPKATALYRKVLKIRPDDDHALLQSAEIAARQGLLADAKAMLGSVIEHRLRRGDRQGACQVALRLSDLDPSDTAAALQAARAAAEHGDRGAALARFRDAATELLLRGRAPEAIAALLEALALNEQDRPVRRMLVQALLETGDPERARAYALEAAEMVAVAAALEAGGHEDAAVEILIDVVRADAAASDSRAHLLRLLARRGEWARASELVADGRFDDADLEILLLAGEAAARAGRAAEARPLFERAVARAPEAAGRLVAKGCDLAGSADAEAAFTAIEAVSNAAVSARRWTAAADALARFLDRVPGFVPALTRLVEVSVDGDLPGVLLRAQAQLADAYLASGHAAEARVIAEDLIGRQPGDDEHVERLRRALRQLGEPDPEKVIAERTVDGLLEELRAADAGGAEEEMPAPAPGREPDDEGAMERADVFRLSPGAIDVQAILGEETAERPPERPEAVEVDLSQAIGDLTPVQPPGSAVAPAEAPGREPGADLEAVFDEFRQEVQHDRSEDAAEQQFKLAAMYQAMGVPDEAIKALRLAARSARHRFEAASQLARLYRDRGMLQEAIEWLERAAEAPASSVEAGHALLYDLGDVLERAGESARALAVFLELQTDAGRYRDVRARIERLSHAGD